MLAGGSTVMRGNGPNELVADLIACNTCQDTCHFLKVRKSQHEKSGHSSRFKCLDAWERNGCLHFLFFEYPIAKHYLLIPVVASRRSTSSTGIVRPQRKVAGALPVFLTEYFQPRLQ